MIPAWKLFGTHVHINLFNGLYVLFWTLYFAFAASQFFTGARLWSAFRGWLAALLAQAVVTFAIGATIYYHAQSAGLAK